MDSGAPNDPAAREPASPDALRLGPSLRIQDVEQAYRALTQALDGPAPVWIDLTGLADVDTAGLQLLLACRREGTRRGIDLRFRGESALLERAFRLLGFELDAPQVKAS